MQVTRGDLAALVRDKSRSVQDLMVLTHLEPMSDVIEYAGAATRQVKHNENEFFFSRPPLDWSTSWFLVQFDSR